MTIGEQNYAMTLKQASLRFEKSVERLIKLEAMKASGKQYTEQDYLNLLEDE